MSRANWEMVAFVEWLSLRNHTRPTAEQVGFYELDMDSLHESMAVVIDYLTQNIDQSEALHPLHIEPQTHELPKT